MQALKKLLLHPANSTPSTASYINGMRQATGSLAESAKLPNVAVGNRHPALSLPK